MRFSARSLLNTTDFNNNWQHTLNLTVPSGTGNALTMSLQITMSWANLAALPTLNNEQFLAPSYSWLYITNKPKNTTSHHNRSKLTNHHRLILLESNSQYHHCKNWPSLHPINHTTFTTQLTKTVHFTPMKTSTKVVETSVSTTKTFLLQTTLIWTIRLDNQKKLLEHSEVIQYHKPYSCITKVEVDSFGMTNEKNAIGFRRESCLHLEK